MQKKILITGSTGFVGRHLVKKLLQDGHSILEITRKKEKSFKLFGDATSKVVVSDINFKNQITKFNPDIVIHLAAHLTPGDKSEDIKKLIDSNILFISKLLNAVSRLDLDLFINTGTFAEYSEGDNEYSPAYFYSATKTASRSIVNYYSNTHNFKQCTVVPYTIYGGKSESKKIIDLILESTESQRKLELTPGDQVLDFIHIDDVISFYQCLIHNVNKISDKSNFKLGTGKGHNLKEVANKVESLTNKKTNISWGAKDYRKCDVMYAVADLDEINNQLTWTPKVCIDIGISKLIESE